MQIEKILNQCVVKSKELLQLGLYQDCLKIINQALKIDPENYEFLKIKSLALFIDNQLEYSKELLLKLIEINPSDIDNYENLGQIYLKLKCLEKAHENMIKCCELSKKEKYVINISLFYKFIGKLETAIQTMEFFIKHETYTNESIKLLGILHGQNKQYKRSINYLNQALLAEPENPQIHTDLAYCYHMINEWNKAWKHYEYRLFKKSPITDKINKYFDPNKKLKNKHDLFNKKIVIYCEQGIGDYINFIRFIPNKENILLEAPPPIKSLLQKIGYKTFNLGDSIEYDFHCSVMSLPYILNNQIISKNKYIYIDEKYDFSKYKGFKLGIVWGGNPAHPNDKFRSLNLKYFDNLTKISNINVFSLQKDTRLRVYYENPNEKIDLTSESIGSYINLSDKMYDFLDTAKIINSLDLVISVDTSVMHLSSAMGVETWGLISQYPDWRWGDVGSDNKWYDSLILFRNKDNWESVFEKIEYKLKEKVVNFHDLF